MVAEELAEVGERSDVLLPAGFGLRADDIRKARSLGLVPDPDGDGVTYEVVVAAGRGDGREKTRWKSPAGQVRLSCPVVFLGRRGWFDELFPRRLW